MDSIQIWHVVVTSFEGVPYFKVTLNSLIYVQIWHVVVTSFEGVPYFKVTLNSLIYVFSFSMEYTESNFRNFIQLLELYITGHR